MVMEGFDEVRVNIHTQCGRSAENPKIISSIAGIACMSKVTSFSLSRTVITATIVL